MAKVRQKVSGRFRTAAFAQACCRISSCLQTMAAPGHNPLAAVTIALQGKAVDCLDRDTEQPPGEQLPADKNSPGLAILACVR